MSARTRPQVLRDQILCFSSSTKVFQSLCPINTLTHQVITTATYFCSCYFTLHQIPDFQVADEQWILKKSLKSTIDSLLEKMGRRFVDNKNYIRTHVVLGLTDIRRHLIISFIPFIRYTSNISYPLKPILFILNHLDLLLLLAISLNIYSLEPSLVIL